MYEELIDNHVKICEEIPRGIEFLQENEIGEIRRNLFQKERTRLPNCIKYKKKYLPERKARKIAIGEIHKIYEDEGKINDKGDFKRRNKNTIWKITWEKCLDLKDCIGWKDTHNVKDTYIIKKN